MKKKSKLHELKNKINEYEIEAIENIEISVLKELSDEMDEISDPRDEAYVRHKLGDIIIIMIFAVMANANEWIEIEMFGKKKEAWLRTFLELPYGIPTDDTFRIVISKLNINYVYDLVIGFLIKKLEEAKQIFEIEKDKDKQHIALDGKVSKSSKRETTEVAGSKAVNTLNAYSSDLEICIGQEFIEEKTNEITVMPTLLNRLDLKGTIVTWDALNTQKEIVKVVINGEGDYVGALKGNHANLFTDVKDYFNEDTKTAIRENKENIQYKKTIEKEHSAIVTREYYIESRIEWINGREEWAGFAAIGMVSKKTEKIGTGETIYEERYYICSITEIEDFARVVRGHWGIENGLHWHLDYTFKDDKNTTKRGNGAEGLQIIKKIVLALLKIAQPFYPPRTSIKRIRYYLSLDFENEVEKIFTVLNADNIKETFYM